jgi:glycosyltransferase involved in cell wall biosynthesis
MPQAHSSRPSLVISTSGNSDALNVVLASIERQSCRPSEVFVADESTDEQCTDVIRSWVPKLRCPVSRLALEPPATARAALFNRAVRAASGQYLIFIEGDCLLHRRFIADHLVHANPGLFVQGRRAGVRARYVRKISTRRFYPLVWFLRRRAYGLSHGLRRPWPTVRLNDLRTVHASNFAVWREDLVKVNGFNENFDETGDELLELALRLRNAGLTLRTVTGHAIVYHLDHRQVARYRSVRSAKIVAETRHEKVVRCQHGLVLLPAAETVTTFATPETKAIPAAPDPETISELSTRLESVEPAPSHFRDKTVPRSMLSRIVHRSS